MASLTVLLIAEVYPTIQQWSRPQITHRVSGAVTAQIKGEQDILENRFIAGACIVERMSYMVK